MIFMLFLPWRFVIYWWQPSKGKKGMKKIASAFVMLGLVTPAVAAPSYLTRTGDGYRVTYDYTDKAKTGWYVGGRAELGFGNWKNKYSVEEGVKAPQEFDHDSYSFEPALGGNIFGGRRFAYFWRAELEAGYLGYFEDADHAARFTMRIPYIMANLYYDFTNNVYLGAGVGAAMPVTTIDMVWSDGSERREFGVAPMAGIMLGYSYELDYNLVLDFRYRLSAMTGLEQRISDLMFEDDPKQYWFQNDIDFIMDNSISIGIRYEF